MLLILAGISIAALTGDNGILTNAQQTSTQSAYKGAEEQVKIAYMAVKTEIMAQTTKNGTYNPASPENTQKLANIVRKDLGLAEGATNSNGTWKVDDTTEGVIKIEYTNSKIDQGVMGEATITKLGDTTDTVAIPREEGYVHYQINLLGRQQDAKLYVDVKDDETVTPLETYEVGQVVTLGTGANAEDFYVVADGGDTLTLITKLCVETTNYAQSTSADPIQFDSYDEDNGETHEDSTDVYANASIKDEVDNYVAAFKSRWGKTNANVTGRLLLISDIVSWGLELNHGYDDSEYNWDYDGDSDLWDMVVNTSFGSYWLGDSNPTYYEGYPCVWITYSNSYLTGDFPDSSELLRPVITISKSDL